MYYSYATDYGTFSIRPDPYGTWDLYIDDLRLGNYSAPDVAAQDVALCVTGHWEWDRLRHMPEAADLGSWEAHERN